MFKELTIYRISGDWHPTVAAMEETMTKFAPCGPTQELALGWVPPRGDEHGALVESVDGQRILRFAIETKSVPTTEVKKKAQEAADHIEAATGRKPGRKEMKSLMEDAALALLPAAFPKLAHVPVWIDHENKLIMIGTASQSKLDRVVTGLVQSFDGLAISELLTSTTPQAAMTSWLADSDDAENLFEDHGFSIERECELKSSDEEKSVVKFSRHSLQNDEVRKHITEGKLPTKLAMSWEYRIGFVLTESMRLKKLSFLDGVFEKQLGEQRDPFDADVMLATGELRKMIPSLIDAMGGELEEFDQEA